MQLNGNALKYTSSARFQKKHFTKSRSISVYKLVRRNSCPNRSLFYAQCNFLSVPNFSVPQREAGSGQTPDEPDINLNPVFDRLGPPVLEIDFEDMEAPFSTLIRQGQNPFATDFDGNPLFVVVDHELATPEGVEGPMSVSVKPDIIHFDGDPLSNVTNETDQKIETDLSNTQMLRT